MYLFLRYLFLILIWPFWRYGQKRMNEILEAEESGDKNRYEKAEKEWKTRGAPCGCITLIIIFIVANYFVLTFK